MHVADQATPRVTVLMAVFNGSRHLRQAIDSVLAQTHRDFELLIVDDASTDDTREIVRSYADPRLRLVCLPVNQGLPSALNQGVPLARGAYVARLDHDDVALPGRLARQVALLDRCPEVVVVGSWVRTIDVAGRPRGEHRYPLRPTLTRLLFQHALLRPCLAHPATMVRTAALRAVGGYDERYAIAQDYDLWLRLAGLGRLRNLPEALTLYREHHRSLSKRRRQQLRLEVAAILDGQLARLLPALEPGPRRQLGRLLQGTRPDGDQTRVPEALATLLAALRQMPHPVRDRGEAHLRDRALLFTLPQLARASLGEAARRWRALGWRVRGAVCSATFARAAVRALLWPDGRA